MANQTRVRKWVELQTRIYKLIMIRGSIRKPAQIAKLIAMLGIVS